MAQVGTIRRSVLHDMGYGMGSVKNIERFKMNTDAIEECIKSLDEINSELPSSFQPETYDLLKQASEQLSALTERIAQLEGERDGAYAACKKLRERIVELEQQLRLWIDTIGAEIPEDCKDYHDNADAEKPIVAAGIMRRRKEDIAELEQQIQQAEKRGYELAQWIDDHVAGVNELTYEEAAAQKTEQERKQ